MKEYRDQCHCGKVQFAVTTNLDPVNRCNCSLCSKKGAIMHRVNSDRFTSIHATLNHILVSDRIWLTRFEGKQIPSSLDTILYEDFDELQQMRVSEDRRIEIFADNLTADLGSTIQYINNAGKKCTDPVDLLVAHFFNHQTHHRGQIHDMLTQTAIAPPSLDMHRLMRP